MSMEEVREMVCLRLGHSLFMKWKWVWWNSCVNCRDSMEKQKKRVERKEERREETVGKQNQIQFYPECNLLFGNIKATSLSSMSWLSFYF